MYNLPNDCEYQLVTRSKYAYTYLSIIVMKAAATSSAFVVDKELKFFTSCAVRHSVRET